MVNCQTAAAVARHGARLALQDGPYGCLIRAVSTGRTARFAAGGGRRRGVPYSVRSFSAGAAAATIDCCEGDM